MAQALEVPGMISLAAGFVDQESLPHGEIAELMKNMMKQADIGQAALQYGTTQGDLEFRTLLMNRLHRERIFFPHSTLDDSHCIVGSGSQQILYLAAETVLDEGDIVLLEAPTYFVVLGVFGSRGACPLGIDTDEQGMIPERLEESLERLQRDGRLNKVKMLYLMTYATNPLGVTLPQERRERIFSILCRYRERGFPILLVEDAAYRRLVYEGETPLPIKSLDENNDRILYTESFSKSLSPGLRLGFGVGPKSIIDKMTDLKGNHDFGSSNLAQQVMKTILHTGLFDRHGQTLNQVYRHKRDVVQEILKEHFPSEAHWYTPYGGFYTWITLPPTIDTGPRSDLFRMALEEKVLYVPGCLCYSSDRPESKFSSSIRLSFGMIGENRLREGCERLARALTRFMDTRSSEP